MSATRRWLDMVRRLETSTLTKTTPVNYAKVDYPENNQQPTHQVTPERPQTCRDNLDKWSFETRDANQKFKWQYLIPSYSFFTAWKCLRVDKNFSLFKWLGLGLWGEFLKTLPYALILLSIYGHFNKNIAFNIPPLWILIMGLIFCPAFSYLSKLDIENNYHGKNPFYFP